MELTNCYRELSLTNAEYMNLETASNALKLDLKKAHIIDAANALMVETIVSHNDATQLALEKIIEVWPSFNLAHPDLPSNLIKIMLLYVCDYLAEKSPSVASILWLTISDVYQYMPLSTKNILKEDFIIKWGKASESQSISRHVSRAKLSQFKDIPTNENEIVSEDENSVLTDVLTTKINTISLKSAEGLNLINNYFYENYTSLFEKIEILWWFEAKYSNSLGKTYRQLSPHIVPLIMALDLVELLPILPSTTSTVYFLAEAVNNIPESSFEKKYPITEILEFIRENKEIIKKINHFSTFDDPYVSTNTPLNLYDLIIEVVMTEISIQEIINLSIIQLDEISLPELAKAIFRQEQGFRMSEEEENE